MTVKDALRLQVPSSIVTVLKLVAWLGAAALLAAGFDFKTPRQRFAEQDARIATTESDVGATDAKVDILLKLQCLDPKISTRDRQLVGLNCVAVLGPSLMQTGAQQDGTTTRRHP